MCIFSNSIGVSIPSALCRRFRLWKTSSRITYPDACKQILEKVYPQTLRAVVAVQMAAINCAEAYRIDDRVGSIAPGRLADILIVEDLDNFRVRQVIANGKLASCLTRNVLETASLPHLRMPSK